MTDGAGTIPSTQAGLGVAPTTGRRRIVAASSWSVGGLATTQALRLVSNLLLARLLTPEDFGTAAIVTGLLSGLQMFSDVGLIPAVVRSARGEDPAFLRTAFTVQVGRGVLLGLLMAVLAWPASFLYGPAFATLAPVAGLVALLGGATSSGMLLEIRRMNQRGIAALETVSFALQLVWTLAWAALWPGVWALVVGNLVGSAARAVLSHWWFPGVGDRLLLEAAAVREIMTFGRWIFVSTAVTFLSLHSDRLVLGAVMPKAVVGVYSMAAMLSRLPGDLISRLAGQVLFPALAEAGRNDVPRLLRAAGRARRVILPAVLTASVVIACTGPILFLVLYPPAYRDATWMLPMLVAAAWFPLLQSAVDRTLLVTGHTRLLATSNAIRAVVAVGGSLAFNALFHRLDAPGEHAAGIMGFILGLTASGLAGYATVMFGLTSIGARFLAPDFAFTVAASALIGGTFCGVSVWTSRSWPGGALAGWVVMGGLSSLIACAWGFWAVRRELSGAGAHPGGTPAS